MTPPEQPQPYPGDLIAPPSDRVRLHREYRDVLGRPLRGKIRIDGAARAKAGESVTAAARVTVELVDGCLDVELPPGRYRLSSSDLRTVDGSQASEDDEVTLSA